MAHHHNRERMLTPPDNRTLTNQPTSPDSTSEEVVADVDEPPDDQNTPRPPFFTKSSSVTSPRKLSALTKMIHSSEEHESDEEDEVVSPISRRGFSSTSTWSNPSIASTAELTSDGLTSPDTRTNTPSPPPPSTVAVPAVLFNKKPFGARTVAIKDQEPIDPLQRTSTPDSTAKTFEAGLGRKRCIAFACGRKDTPKEVVAVEKKPEAKIEEPPKRKCMLTFACPSKTPKKEEPSAVRKPSIGRAPSPAPLALKTRTPASDSPRRSRAASTSHQSVSPKALRKTSSASRLRRLSTAGEADTIETERVGEYLGLRAEDDDWMKERTCHRSRLTVDDTLKVEMNLRKLGKEAEEEEDIEDEAELDNEGFEADEEEVDIDDEEEDGVAEMTATGEDESDDGFYSDDEGGMAGSSDDESDADSDYRWWAPGRSTAATSYEQLDHMHFSRQRNMSGSSIGSISSTKAIAGEKPEPFSEKKFKKRPAMPIRTRESDLPDSTDFVCGTFDEDRPMEESYRREIEMRRAAKHRVCPQDIDPTFPTSDPEMDEEDDEDVFPNHHEDDSDVQGVFGNFEADDVSDGRGRTRNGRSPIPSPKRLHSPPPRRATIHRSPPPRKLFGNSPRRLRSPPPSAIRLRSPPPTRRPSFAKSPKSNHIAFPSIALAERPQGQHNYSASLPRKPNLLQTMFQHHRAPSPIPDADNDSGEEGSRANLPARGAIDIVKGLEKKRQLRKEKLYQKYCRQRANGTVKAKEEKRCVPGKGAERMRELVEKKYQYGATGTVHDAQHILSL